MRSYRSNYSDMLGESLHMKDLDTFLFFLKNVDRIRIGILEFLS